VIWEVCAFFFPPVFFEVFVADDTEGFFPVLVDDDAVRYRFAKIAERTVWLNDGLPP